MVEVEEVSFNGSLSIPQPPGSTPHTYLTKPNPTARISLSLNYRHRPIKTSNILLSGYNQSRHFCSRSSHLSSLTMSKGPGLFVDIGKKAKDILTANYTTDQKLSVNTCTENGLILTSTAVKKGELSIGDVAAKYKYKNVLIDVKVDTDSKILTTLTVLDVVPNTKSIASFKLPDFNSGKFEVQYFHPHATLTTALSSNHQVPIVDVTATIGTPSIAFGAEAGYDTKSSNFTKYTVGVSVSKPDSSASIIFGDKGDSLKASYVHYLDETKKNAAVGEIARKFSSNDNTFTFGGSYAIDPLTTVKAKLNNYGKVGALLQHELIPKSLLTVSTEVDTKALDRTPKLGLSIALIP